MYNISEEPLTHRQLFCSRHWSGDNYQHNNYLLHFYKTVVFLYTVLATTATLGNSLILVALHEDSSLHPPSKLLLQSLAITDLCVGTISLPVAITFLLSTINENWQLCLVTEYTVYVITTICSGVSLSTLTAISVDRLLALLLGLRYRQVVTVKRIRWVVFSVLDQKLGGRYAVPLGREHLLHHVRCVNTGRGYNCNLFLHKNLSHNSASTNSSSSHSWSRPKRNYRTKHGALQKDSV